MSSMRPPALSHKAGVMTYHAIPYLQIPFQQQMDRVVDLHCDFLHMIRDVQQEIVKKIVSLLLMFHEEDPDFYEELIIRKPRFDLDRDCFFFRAQQSYGTIYVPDEIIRKTTIPLTFSLATTSDKPPQLTLIIARDLSQYEIVIVFEEVKKGWYVADIPTISEDENYCHFSNPSNEGSFHYLLRLK